MRLLLLVLFAVPLFAQAQVDWFTLLPHVADRWQLSPDPDRSDRFKIQAVEGEGARYNVVVLFPKQSSAYDTAMAQILGTFSEKKLAAQFEVINFGGDTAAGLAVLAELRDKPVDLIYSMGSGSTSFLVENYGDGQIPVVSVCSKDPVLMGQVADYESGSGSHMAFTSLDVPIKSQLAYLRQLNPSLERIAVLYAQQNTSAVKTQVEPLVAEARKENIEIIPVVVAQQSSARSELAAKIPEVTAKILAADPKAENSIYWITGSTSVFREIAVINQHSDRIPVLSVVPNVVKAGDDSAVLSIGVTFENNAQIAAIYGFKVLSGQEKAGDLPVGVVRPPDIAVNFKKARAIGLKIPFSFFESAGFVYDHNGELVREKGRNLIRGNK